MRVLTILMLLSESCTQDAVVVCAFERNFCSLLIAFIRVGFSDIIDLKNQKMRNLYFIMLNVKIHGVAQETRPMACVLDLEGLALMPRGLVALFYLLYFLIDLQRLSLRL
jgi:hypothetical protein